MRSRRQSPILFFFAHAGYSYDPTTQTALQGRWQTARALADAEAWAHAVATYRWEYDDQPWDGDSEPPREVLGCIMDLPNDPHIASLWGIGDPSPAYRRVIEAELALEARHAITESVMDAI